MAARPMAKPTDSETPESVVEQPEPVETTAPEAAQAETADTEGATPDKSTDADAKPGKKAKHRIEVFEATKPDGTVVVVTRNIDTGDQKVTDKK